MEASLSWNILQTVKEPDPTLDLKLNKRKLYDVDIDDPVPNKSQKVLNDSKYFTNVVEDWMSEYNRWYTASFDQDIGKIFNTVKEFKNDHPEYCFNSSESHFNQTHEQAHYIQQFADTNYDSANQDSVINHLHIPNLSLQFPPPSIASYKVQCKANRKNVGYWGPLLRYGTYGVYRRYVETVFLRKRRITTVTKSTEHETLKESIKYSFDIPPHIKMPRQSMLYTLQLHAKSKLSDLRRSEADTLLHMNVNYSAALEQLANQCGTCPKYLFTKVCSIPRTEREYFTSDRKDNAPSSFLSLDCSRFIDIRPIQDFHVCELFISDIIMSQGFALWKRRAQETCARKAFKVLDRPCHLVGATRYWHQTDYLTACVSEDPNVVTLLPPFVTDPTEPLYKKDEKINKLDPDDNFDISNPKSMNDFWLYVPTLLEKAKIKDIDPQILLYQSAEFSQMNISFEIETCCDESYTCTVLIDKSTAVTVEGLGSLEQARRAASLVLVDKLIDTQPIVVLQQCHHARYDAIVKYRLFQENGFVVRSLMWSPNDVNQAVPFHDMSDVIDSDSNGSKDPHKHVSSRDVINEMTDLVQLFTSFAQSSLVYPIKVARLNVTRDLWSRLADVAMQAGLLVLHDDHRDDQVLLCKQVPHKQLKAHLLDRAQFGVFSLLCRGRLPETYTSDLCELLSHQCYSPDESPGDQEQDFLLKSHEDTNTSSCPPDIINDIPRELIPGIDF